MRADPTLDAVPQTLAPREVDLSDEVRPKSRPHPTDGEIERFARAQHGVVTAAQLRDLGLGERGSGHRAATRRLQRLHRGVFAVERPQAKGRWLAAVLACGDGAVLSHASAAALWGLIPGQAAEVHVNVAGVRRRGPVGIAIHRAMLDRDDVTSQDGIPCTTLARTFVDVAAAVERGRLERAIVLADERGEFDLGALREQLARMAGRRGCAALAAALAGFDERAIGRSVAETRFLALVRRARLPTPEANVWIPLPEGGGYRPDFLWRERRLIVEVDGRAHHSRRRAFDHDRRRDRRLFLAGYTTLRFPAREVLSRPTRVASELRTLLDRSPAL
jgi:very-short-patch-repair endonuclease